MKRPRSPSPVVPFDIDVHSLQRAVECKHEDDDLTESSAAGSDSGEEVDDSQLGLLLQQAFGKKEETPEETPADSNEPKTILTVYTEEQGSDMSSPDSELLQNVIARVRERGSILSYFVIKGGGGWLWMKMGTEAQATRAAKRLHGVKVLQKRFTLVCQQTRLSDWPPGVAPAGERTVPALPRHDGGRRWTPDAPRRPGGVRHRRGSASASSSASVPVHIPSFALPTHPQPTLPPPPERLASKKMPVSRPPLEFPPQPPKFPPTQHLVAQPPALPQNLVPQCQPPAFPPPTRPTPPWRMTDRPQ